MTTHYKVLRPVTPADLKTGNRFAKVLEMIPPDGYMTFGHFKNIEATLASKGVAHACSCGILKRVSPYERVLSMNSVKFWSTQLNESGHKNTTTNHSTRQLYLHKITNLDYWLPGKTFQSHKTVMNDGQIKHQPITKSFANVEELLQYCTESDHGIKTAQRIIREYLTSPQISKMSDSMYATTRSAIKSYFSVNDQVLNLPRNRKKRAGQTASGDSFMTLEDFYKMMRNGKTSIVMRTVMLIKLQSGMDSSTFADRFNYEGYSQITKYFKTDDHKLWNLEMCPVPIRLVRVKTGVQYTTFLDHDAIVQLREYLTWKETMYDRQDPSEPLFMTKKNKPISSLWLSRNFSNVAVRTGIQEKVSPTIYKIRAHEVRDLLKSTLIASGCKQYAADHVLGHAPRDSYEKQTTLYPEELRAEYIKVSSRINILSKVESTLNTPDDPESLHARIKELEAQAAGTGTANAEIALLERRHQKSIQGMYGMIESLREEISSLREQRDTVKDD